MGNETKFNSWWWSQNFSGLQKNYRGCTVDSQHKGHSMHQHSYIAPRLLEQTSLFGVVFFYPSLFWELRKWGNFFKFAVLFLQALESCKNNNIFLLYGQLRERARWTKSCNVIGYVSGQDGAISGLPVVSNMKNFPESQIINPLLTKFVWSRWLDIGFILFLQVYGPRLRLGP